MTAERGGCEQRRGSAAKAQGFGVYRENNHGSNTQRGKEWSHIIRRTHVTGNPWCLRWMPTMEIPGIPLHILFGTECDTHTHTSQSNIFVRQVDIKRERNHVLCQRLRFTGLVCAPPWRRYSFKVLLQLGLLPISLI